MSVPDGSPGVIASSRVWRYAVAVLSVVIAASVRLALDPWLGKTPLFVFLLAIMVAAKFGGYGPGLVASALSVPVVAYFFTEPRFSFAISDPRDVGSLAALAIAGVAISLLLGHRMSARQPGTEIPNRWSFLRRTILFVSAFVVLAVLTRLLYADFARQKEQQQWVARSYQVLNAIQVLMSDLQDAEIGQRGYLLTGDESYRKPFDSSLREERSARQTLRHLTADNPAQQTRLAALDRLVEAKFAELEKTMSLHRNQGLAAALAEVRTNAGQRIMDECRATLAAMQEDDRRLLAERTRAAAEQATRMRWVLGLGSGSLLMLLVIAGAVIERDSRDSERSRLAVSQSEERLRLALDAAQAGTWEWDLKTNENVWSEELWKVYGIEPHSRVPSYDAWREVVHPEDRENTEQVVAQAARSGSELNVEFRVCNPGGAERWLLSRGRALRDGKGRAVRFAGIALDITARRLAEDAMRARERDLRRFAEFAPVAIAMFDREMRYLAASRRFREDFSLGDGDLIGRSHYDVFPEISENWREIHRRCLAGAVERHPGEPFLRSDGSEQWIRWEIQPWHAAGGAIGGIILFSEEITRQKRAEQAVRESEARLRLAQQVARVGTFEWNIQTGLHTWTPELEAMYGLAPGEFGGTLESWQSLVHPADWPETARLLKQAMETGRFEGEWRVVWPDGAMRWMSGRGSVFRDEANQPLRLIGVNIDITEAKAADQALRGAQTELRKAQSVARLGTWHWDIQSDTVTCSEELYRLYGLDPNLPFPDFPNRDRFYTPESGKRLKADVQAALQTGTEYELDLELVPACGPGIWVTARGEAVRGAAGEIVALHGTLQDVTRRKRAEEEILARSAVLHAISQVFSAAISCETEAALGRDCLAIVEALTGSRGGFIGQTNAHGHLAKIATSGPGWDAWRIGEFAGRVLLDGQGFFANEPSARMQVTSFLGVPLLHSGKTIGMIALGNREGGYRARDLESLEALAPAIVQAFLRKRAEDALRESEAQFRSLANAIPQLCWMADEAGWIFWYNQRWYDYTGTTPEEMEGWGWKSVHDPAALPKVLERWNASIATGDPFDMVLPLRGADGLFRPFLTRVMPVRDREGRIVRWFGTNTDISEQQQTEEALRQVSEQQRLALEAAELGAWDYNFETGQVFWDEACCHMFGVHTGPISDEEAISRIHADDRPAIRVALNQALAGLNGGAYHIEFRVVWPDGLVHWIASHGRVHFEDRDGCRQAAQFIGVNMDITARKQAELEIRLLNTQLEQRVRERTAQLETTNKELEAFAYSVSHDLRAPLRGIDGWSLALAEDYAVQLDERGLKYLDRVRSETQRMGVLIDDMLQLSRVARAEMQPAAVDLTAIAHGIAARLSEAAPDSPIEFVIEPGLTALGDARLLEIALTNLLSNAVKFTGPRARPRIEFARANHNGCAAFLVRDNGVGFNMDYAAKLFRAFQRLHKTSEFPGTGVGLAIVQRVIHRHTGKVWAEAEVDRGATFYFTLGEPG